MRPSQQGPKARGAGADEAEAAAPTSRGALLVAAAVSIVVGVFVPFGDLLLYPFTLLATWVHEMGHGFASLAVGGGFDHLEIFSNAAGLAHTTGAADGWRRALVSLGGLVAPPIVGMFVLAGARGPRRAQTILVGFSVALVVSLAIWVRSVAGFISVPVLAAIIVVFVRWGSARERMFMAQLIGLRLALDTLGRGMSYLFTDSVKVDGVARASDIASVASGFGGPRLLWSVLVSSVCLTFVAVGLVLAWRAPRRAARARTRLHGRNAAKRRSDAVPEKRGITPRGVCMAPF